MLGEFIRKQKAKSDLNKCFHNADLFKTYKNSGGRTFYSYPKIHAVEFKDDYTRYVFTLLTGMDPKDIDKKNHVFKQSFGANIELEGDYKRFSLTIHNKSMPSELKYNFDEINAHVCGFNLGIICGKDRHSQYVSFDLTKQPHILIAGETGSGKSTQLRSILTTLIKTKRPSELHSIINLHVRNEYYKYSHYTTYF